jgi:hypothetical protein
MVLLDICLITAYLQFEDIFCQQKREYGNGKLATPVISNIFVEHFEGNALDSTDHKTIKFLRYVEDTSVLREFGRLAEYKLGQRTTE